MYKSIIMVLSEHITMLTIRHTNAKLTRNYIHVQSNEQNKTKRNFPQRKFRKFSQHFISYITYTAQNTHNSMPYPVTSLKMKLEKNVCVVGSLLIITLSR